MKVAESILPRVLATILLLVSLSLFATLLYTILFLARGAEVAPRSWFFPLAILANGAALMWLLNRRQLPLQLYLAAFGLWVFAAGFYLFHLGALVPH
jgi:hypothetical protein